MKFFCWLRGFGVLVTGLYFSSVAGVWAGAKVDFNRDVRPVLADNCYACHGPDETKVKGGLRLDSREAAMRPTKSGAQAIVPGKPNRSELIRRVLTTDAEDVMPPGESHKVLTSAQKDVLQSWIAQGAEYQGHWAYLLPVRGKGDGGSKGIDSLVRGQLRGLGLKAAPAADRRTLVRRLYFDLTGLPPKPEEVDAFERDTSSKAYELLVDRLMASPHFGERMAIGWLDVVRFADTIGYHSDTPRNIWPYRDYVIRAFNENKRFDEFTREQLAGDLLPNSSVEQKVASGFNRLLLTTEEGGAQAKDYEVRYMTDRVRAVGAIWLGQTLGCAQCHDHKFDPITARDFYSMGAFFADVKEPIIGAREPGMLVPDAAQTTELGRLDQGVKTLELDYNGAHPELAKSFGDWERSELARLVLAESWVRWVPAQVESSEGTTLKVREDRSILASGKNPDKDNYTLRFTNEVSGVLGLRLEALPDDSLPAKGSGRASNGNFVVTEVVARVERGGKEVRKVGFASAQATVEQSVAVENNPYQRWTAASAIDGDIKGTSAGWAILPEVGKAQQLQLTLKEALTVVAGETLTLEIQQRHGAGGHNLGRFSLARTVSEEAVRSLGPEVVVPEFAALLKIPAAQRDEKQSGQLFAHYKTLAPEMKVLREALPAARKAKSDFEGQVARSLVTERNDSPRTVRILPRGNWMVETGPEVEPALPAFLTLGKAKVEGRRLSRLDLAEWLVAPENPLTARVVVNRFWKQFFGMGLSKVMDDFGAQGEPPPQRALLDWLACEFRDSGWDVKHMIRLMVMSETYRQKSEGSRENLAKDPENRGLARQGRWRLEAELVRDNALSLAGLLSPSVGGPSANPYQPAGYWENLNFPQRTYQASLGDKQYRRGLYTWWQRSFVHPSLLAFDAPTREECAAERNRSNIPQQALVLLNDPSYVEAARSLAVRILQECEGDTSARLVWAWRLAVARSPRAEELVTVRRLFDKHLAEFQRDPEAAARYLKVGATPAPAALDPAELAAWTDVARTLLNLHETITRS